LIQQIMFAVRRQASVHQFSRPVFVRGKDENTGAVALRDWGPSRDEYGVVPHPSCENEWGLSRDVWDGVMMHSGSDQAAMGLLESWIEPLFPRKSISATQEKPPHSENSPRKRNLLTWGPCQFRGGFRRSGVADGSPGRTETEGLWNIQHRKIEPTANIPVCLSRHYPERRGMLGGCPYCYTIRIPRSRRPLQRARGPSRSLQVGTLPDQTGLVGHWSVVSDA
jgi:hypothetical protein